ncbi:permease [Candidatus Aerophobetes bacterium]|nr:permease [Candidatus Aerophobetes bacterium]
MKMFFSTVIMALVACVLMVVAYFKQEGLLVRGLNGGLKLFLQILPLLFFAFMVAGLVQVLVPKEVIAKWIGRQSGIRGILIGCVAGGLAPGGPYVALPIVAGLYQAGASIGTVVSFITAWSLWAVSRMPLEFGILGAKIALARLLSTLIFPPVAGLIAQIIFSRWVG